MSNSCFAFECSRHSKKLVVNFDFHLIMACWVDLERVTKGNECMCHMWVYEDMMMYSVLQDWVSEDGYTNLRNLQWASVHQNCLRFVLVDVMFWSFLLLCAVYPQKQPYGYGVGYPGPYYHGAQYGPYNYWSISPATSRHGSWRPITPDAASSLVSFSFSCCISFPDSHRLCQNSNRG
jgi:hypothetical protein